MLSVQSRIWLSQRAGLPRLARRFGKFGVVGLSGVGVNMAVFWLLFTRLHLHYLPSAALAIETAMCTNYLLNNNWTFADRRRHVFSVSGLARYHAVSFGGMLINLATLQVLAGWLGVAPMLANLAGIAVATGWNFSLNLFWTWRRPHRAATADPSPFGSVHIA